jgi:hypothetical protein
MQQKFLTIYPDDFRNINDWYAVCDQLKIDSQKETNILEHLN